MIEKKLKIKNKKSIVKENKVKENKVKENKDILDLLIIGAGPAGMTAAIYASRTWMNFKIIEKLSPGGQMIKTDKIDNYPGLPGISGVDLSLQMMDHLKKLGTNILMEEAVKLEKNGDIFRTVLRSGKEILSKNIVVATGVVPRKLMVKGEEKFESKGISYCATCDGYFYKDKIVAVVGKGNSAVTSAIYLSKIAKKVYLINKDNDFKQNSRLIENLKEKENVEILYNSNIINICGNDHIEEIIVEEKIEKKKTNLNVDGIFVLIGNIPNSDIVKDLADICRKKEIIIDDYLETNIEGLYAIGDVITKSVRQIVTATSDGAKVIEIIENRLLNK